MSTVEERMRYPTLDEFVSKDTSRFPRAAYIEEDGFEELYVRISARTLDRKTFDRVFTIARVRVTQPGKGTVWKLIDRFLNSGIPVYVECVHNARFAEKLKERGFQVMNENCFYKLPKEQYGTETC